MRRAAAAALAVLGRIIASEAELYVRWTLRAVLIAAVLTGVWSWWLRPAIETEVARHREAAVAELREAVTPDLPDWRGLKEKIAGGAR